LLLGQPLPACYTNVSDAARKMGSVLTEGFSLQNCAVIAFVILWFIGWTYAAKNMMRRSELQKREMVMTAKREIEQQKQRVAKAAAGDSKKSK
jgi:hypothetical protein